jgi:hypothetical protein
MVVSNYRVIVFFIGSLTPLKGTSETDDYSVVRNGVAEPYLGKSSERSIPYGRV